MAAGSTTKSVRSLNTISRNSKPSGIRRPLLTDAFCLDLQKGSYVSGIYSIVIGFFTLAHSVFDLYCLVEAAPGSVHYGYYPISFDFVYSGNPVIRGLLLAIVVTSLLFSLPVICTSFNLILGLRREHEQRFKPWLYTMFFFIIFRVVAFIFWNVVNDIMFGYHIAMLILWIIITGINIFSLLVVYSNYQELADITRLEDMAKLKMGTLSSLHTLGSQHSSRHSINSHPVQPSPSRGSYNNSTTASA